MSNYNTTLQSNNTDLQAILNTINELPEAVEQATPVISVNTSGLITATAGAKSSTHQLAFQPAKTITPSTASQIAVSSGYYTGGNVTVAGDSNLVAGNIKSGVSIFGVSGNYEGSGGSGDTSIEDGFATRSFSVYMNDRVTSVGHCAFYSYDGLKTVSFPKVTDIRSRAFAWCTSLSSVSFPEATTIFSNAFYSCIALKTVSFPKVTDIGSSAFNCCANLSSVSFPEATTIRTSAFYSCIALETVSFPKATKIEAYAFYNCKTLSSVSFPEVTIISNSAFYSCTPLTSVSFPKVSLIGNYAFKNCQMLSKIYLQAPSVCALSNSNAFSSTSIWSNKGLIYVPSSLVSSYKTATNWTLFSNRICRMT